MNKKYLAFTSLAALLVLVGPTNASAYTQTNCDYNRYSDTISCTSYDPGAALLQQLRLDAQIKLLQLQIDADLAKSKQADQQIAQRYQQELIQHESDKATDRFKEVFGRDPNGEEFSYWFNRIRQQSLSHDQVKDKMRYYKATGQTMPAGSAPKVAGTSSTTLAPQINSIFRGVYGRNPSVSENQYWLSRISDKPTRQAMSDAMSFHKANRINH